MPVAAIIQESHETLRRGTFTDVGCLLVANDGQCRAIRKMRIEGTLRSIFIYDLVVAWKSLKKEEPRFTFQIIILDLVFDPFSQTMLLIPLKSQ